MTTVDFSTDAREDLYRIWNYGRDNWGAKAADQYYMRKHDGVKIMAVIGRQDLTLRL